MANIPSVQRAAVLTGPYGDPYTIRNDIPVPKIKPNEVLLALEYTGVCHGDCYSRDGGPPAPPIAKRPLISGHEGVGRIVAIGNAVHSDPRSWPVKINDRAATAWVHASCGQCEMCLADRDNFCHS